VHTEDLLVDDSSNGQAIEAICESFPEFYIVSSLAFIIEPIDSVDGRTFMVSSKDEEVLRIFDLVGQEQAYRLQTLLSSVDIVTQEKIVGVWWEASIFKQSQQIVVLSVDVPANLNGGF